MLGKENYLSSAAYKNVEVVDGVVRHTKPTIYFKTFVNHH